MPKAPKSRSSGVSVNDRSKPGAYGGFSRSGQFGAGGKKPAPPERRGDGPKKDEKKDTAPSTANPGIEPNQPAVAPPIVPRAPDIPASMAPVTSANPNLPADRMQAERGNRRDLSLIDAIQQPGASRSAQKYRGSVLSAVYRLPTDPANAAKTLQQFNGPRGQRMTLGS